MKTEYRETVGHREIYELVDKATGYPKIFVVDHEALAEGASEQQAASAECVDTEPETALVHEIEAKIEPLLDILGVRQFRLVHDQDYRDASGVHDLYHVEFDLPQGNELPVEISL